MLRVLRLSLVLLFLSLPSWGEQLELRFLDVGQGDAVLIREGGKTALVDAGHSARIVPQLRALGIDTIDLVVASHNHADHIGGMPAVLGGTKVRYYLDNGLPHTTATYRRTIDAVVASGAQYLRASERTITLGSAQLRVLPPPPPSRSQNDSSVGLVVDYGSFRALLTGDSEAYELHYWLTHNAVPRVQVVKVAHHGSSNGTTTEWVQATRPDVAVISVGAVNSYGHPSPSVIGQWQSVGARIRRTDVEGTIVILADSDGTFNVTTERSDGPTIPRTIPQNSDVKAKASDSVVEGCCKVCSRGKACGNSCISLSYVCRQPPGCACDARP